VQIAHGRLNDGACEYLVYPACGIESDAICLASPSVILLTTPERYCIAYSYSGKPARISIGDLARFAALVGAAIRYYAVDVSVSGDFHYIGRGRFHEIRHSYDDGPPTKVGSFRFLRADLLVWQGLLAWLQDKSCATEGRGDEGAFQAAYHRFIAHLDQEALDSAHACCDLSCTAYNYFVAPDLKTRIYRRQAAKVAPALIANMIAGATYMTLFRAAIDAGAPLVDAATEHFGVPRYAIKRFIESPLDRIGVEWSNTGREVWRKRPKRLLLALSGAGPDAWPRTQEQWKAVYDFFHKHLETFDRAAVPVAKIIAFAARRQWHAPESCFLELEEGGKLQACADMLLTMQTVIAERMRTPSIRSSVRTQVESFAADVGLRRLLHWAGKWRACYADIRFRRLASLDTSALDRRVTNPFAVPACIGDLQVVALEYYRQFVEEGVALSHCVRRHFLEAAERTAYFYSLRDSTGHPISTLEVAVGRDASGATARVAEHRGSRDSRPPATCLNAAVQIVAAITAQLGTSPVQRALSAIDTVHIRESIEVEEKIDREARRDALSSTLGSRLQKMIDAAQASAAARPET
jgi:hypothetical protein